MSLEENLRNAKLKAEDEASLRYHAAFAILLTYLPKDVVAKITAPGGEPFLGWIEAGVPLENLDEASAAFLRTTRRINAVVNTWDALQQFDDGSWMYASLNRTMRNESPRHPTDISFLQDSGAYRSTIETIVASGGVPKGTDSRLTFDYMRYLDQL